VGYQFQIHPYQGMLQQGVVEWNSPSNIALVKYWGKYPEQLPRNASLSFALNKSLTTTTVSYYVSGNITKPEVRFLFEGKENTIFASRVTGYLEKIKPYLPFLGHCNLKIDSRNTFPHSSGIASSASSMSALALCLCVIEHNLTGSGVSSPVFFERASFLSRLGSGSASRSVYGGYSVWGHSPLANNSSNEYAVPLQRNIHPLFSELHDAILLVSKSGKKVSSTAGHQLMEGHPFASARYTQADANLTGMVHSMESGDWELFSTITENEALTLHSMMLSSTPSFILLRPESLSIIEKIKYFREQNNLPVCFTIDAGPNIHLIYPAEVKMQVQDFINSELVYFCQEKLWIDDGMGNGPELIQNNKNENKN